jgi:hypothetical protein
MIEQKCNLTPQLSHLLPQFQNLTIYSTLDKV